MGAKGYGRILTPAQSLIDKHFHYQTHKQPNTETQQQPNTKKNKSIIQFTKPMKIELSQLLRMMFSVKVQNRINIPKLFEIAN